MQISENFTAPTKATSGRPAYSPAIYQIQSAIAKLRVSFRSQVKIREGQAGGQHGATVAVGDDGGRVVVVQEWNRDRISWVASPLPHCLIFPLTVCGQCTHHS